jgi:hypothetical protein
VHEFKNYSGWLTHPPCNPGHAKKPAGSFPPFAIPLPIFVIPPGRMVRVKKTPLLPCVTVPLNFATYRTSWIAFDFQ